MGIVPAPSQLGVLSRNGVILWSENVSFGGRAVVMLVSDEPGASSLPATFSTMAILPCLTGLGDGVTMPLTAETIVIELGVAIYKCTQWIA